MKSIFDTEAYEELMARANKLTPDSPRGWGKMSAAQMAWHCQYPLQLAVTNKKTKVNGKFFLARWFFKKSLYNDKPWRKNLPTAPQLVAREEKDFTTEIEKLKALITDCHEVKTRETWNPHPFFGTFTKDQWGQLEYKHLDHHFKQFGV